MRCCIHCHLVDDIVRDEAAATHLVGYEELLMAADLKQGVSTRKQEKKFEDAAAPGDPGQDS